MNAVRTTKDYEPTPSKYGGDPYEVRGGFSGWLHDKRKVLAAGATVLAAVGIFGVTRNALSGPEECRSVKSVTTQEGDNPTRLVQEVSLGIDGILIHDSALETAANHQQGETLNAGESVDIILCGTKKALDEHEFATTPAVNYLPATNSAVPLYRHATTLEEREQAAQHFLNVQTGWAESGNTLPN